ncbi:MAG: hypothetical protein SXA11_21295 [Cyanobacteriota bacterium]|nr:hypothetical protein [Cyanobacteriota bacterium]
MTNKLQPEEVIAKNKDSLQSIARTLKLSQGQFSLIVARCNYGMLREEMVRELETIARGSGVETIEICLAPEVETLYTTLDNYKEKECSPEKQWALMVLGLEKVKAIDKLLTSTNTVREEFRKNFPFPVVLWVNDAISKKLIRLVPDIESWATTYEFSLSPGQIVNFLKHKTQKVFSAVLDTGAEKFLANSSILGADYSKEIELASDDLRHWGINLEPELEASLKFLKGRYYYAHHEIEKALYFYRQSLRFWQHASRSAIASNGDKQKWQEDKKIISAALRRGAVLFHIALCYRHIAEQHRTNRESNWKSARDNLRECIDVFRGVRRDDLVAKFINQLGEILRQTQEWEALEELALAARNLHEDRSEFSIQLAQDYGFLAEVALNKSVWEDAKNSASIALEILDKAPSDRERRLTFVKPQHGGLYLCLLAMALEELGDREGAIECLEKARSQTDPQLDPQLHLNILEFLRNLYFEEGKYRAAFEIKKEFRTIQHQFGYIAFIGAARLKPKLKIINPPLEPVVSSNIAREITASGREQDLEGLIQRIQSTQHKLTIVYGPSGVGKSSIVTAGLVPELKQKTIGARQVVPILLQVYRDWTRELDRQLSLTNKLLSFQNPKIEISNNLASGKRVKQVAGNSGVSSDLFNHNIYGRQQVEILPNSADIPSQNNLACEDTIRCNSAEKETKKLLDKLKKNANTNRLTVLFFDQFDEFFFWCKEGNKSRDFFDFLRECINIPFVKIVISLRDDYLHKLLAASRFSNTEALNNDILGDILSKDNLFYLGNFSQEQAYQVIDSLTKRSHFYLQPILIKELVKDLAGDFGEVRPIELQVVGAQLQADKIATLTKYKELGEKPKQKLVERFLKEVVKECGPENERTAQKVLYLLTDEDGTRPLNTLGELLAYLPEESPEKLELVLEILEESGLVFRWTEIPSDPYQLFHDYLVDFIRKQEEEELDKEKEAEQQAELEAARQREELLRDRNLKLMEEREKDTQIRKMQSQRTVGLSMVLVVVVALAAWAFNEGKRAEYAEQLALKAGSEALALSNYDDPLRRLVSSVKIGQQFLAQTKTTADQKNKIAQGLRLAVSRVQEINRFSGHGKSVLSVSFSPDGSFLASAGADGIIKLFYPDGREIATIEADKLAVSGIAFSPDGKILASGGGEQIIKIWNLEDNSSPELAMVFEGHAGLVTSVSFSPDGKMLVSGSADGIIKLWSIEEGRFLGNLGVQEGEVTSVSFSADGKTVASASGDESASGQNTIKLWEVGFLSEKTPGEGVDGKLLRTLPGHGDWIYSISFSPDGKTIASASADKTVKLWGLDGKEIKTLKGHSDEVLDVVFSRDGKAIASASRDKTVKIWSNEGYDSTLVKTLEGHQRDVWGASFSPNGKTIASASGDSVHLWRRDRTPFRQIMAGHSDWVYGVNFSPDGKTIATGSRDKTIKLWSMSGELLDILVGHEEQVNWVSFSPNGKILASASDDKTIKLWNVERGTISMSLEGHAKKVVAAAFHPDGDRLASIGEDKTFKIWRVADGKLLYSIEYSDLIESNDRLKALSYSPDSQTIAIATRKQVRLWSGDPNAIRNIEFDERADLNSISFSPNSQQIAIAIDKEVRVFGLEGELIDSFTDTEIIDRVSFSPDGRTVVIAAKKKVKLLPFDGSKFGLEGDALPVVLENEDEVIDLAIDPMGENIVIASKDKAIVWKQVNNLALEDIVNRSCLWLEAYLKTNDKVETSDRSLCWADGQK